MKINEITSGARIDYVEGKITKLGKSWKYNDQDIVRATLCDDTGNVKISLWGKHSQKFSNDDCICIRDATEKMVSGEKNIVVYDASIAEKIQKQITASKTKPSRYAHQRCHLGLGLSLYIFTCFFLHHVITFG